VHRPLVPNLGNLHEEEARYLREVERELVRHSLVRT
jgi:hypothetical protein